MEPSKPESVESHQELSVSIATKKHPLGKLTQACGHLVSNLIASDLNKKSDFLFFNLFPPLCCYLPGGDTGRVRQEGAGH